MNCGRSCFPGSARPIFLLVMLLYAGRAQADGFAALLQPGYTSMHSRSEAESGESSRFDTEQYHQLYRLTLDRSLFPSLRLALGGMFDRQQDLGNQDGLRQDLTADRSQLFGDLILAGPLLSASVGASRREESAKALQESRTSRIQEGYHLQALYRPAALPELSLHAGHQSTYDRDKKLEFRSGESVLASTTYRPIPSTDLRYALEWTQGRDHIHHSQTEQQQHTGRLGWNERFWAGRVTALADVEVSHRRSAAWASQAGGVTTTQVYPVGGLSTVEVFPATPTDVALVANPALVDADLGTGASINLGASVSASGDLRVRDMGAELAPDSEPINLVYLWLDRSLPALVIDSLSFSVYVSDDNQQWRAVTVLGVPSFGSFANRFEIRIADVVTRYIKVVAAPIPAAFIADATVADLYVTEIQFFRESPIAEDKKTARTTTGVLNAAVQTRPFKKVRLTHDSALRVLRQQDPVTSTAYSLSNGLSFVQPVREVHQMQARVSRLDTRADAVGTRNWQYSVGVQSNPLPTLGGSISYGGQDTVAPKGHTSGHGWSGFARADLYTGIAATTNMSYTVGSNESRQRTRTRAASMGLTLSPHANAHASSAYTYTRNDSEGGSAPDQTVTAEYLDTSLALNPVRAIYVNGQIVWTRRSGARGHLLVSYGGTFSPFPGGDLQMTGSYSESLDPVTDTLTRMWGPTLRWNIRAGTHLDATYSHLSTESAVASNTNWVFGASLTVVL